MNMIASKPTNNTVAQSSSVGLYSSGKVSGDKGAPAGPKGANVADDQVLEDLLRSYEKAKLKMEGAVIQNNIDLRNSDLGQSMKDDPLFQALVGSDASGKAPSDTDIKNFFFLIFKFLKDHKDADSKCQVAQAVNMLAKEATLDTVTEQSVSSLSDMKSQIQKAEDAANSPLAKFLKIGLPIIMAVATVLITAVTMGAAAPATVAADTALTAAEVGTTSALDSTLSTTVSTTVDTAVADTVAETSEGIEMTTFSESGTVVDDVAVNAAREGAKQAAKTVLSSAVRQGVAGLGKQAGQEVVTAAVKESVEKATTTALKEGLKEVAEEAVKDGANKATQTAVKQAMEEGVKDAVKDAVKEGLSKSWLQTIRSTAGIGLAVAGALTGLDVGVCQHYEAQPDSDYASAVQNATSIEQGEATVNAASSDNLQNDLKINMNNEQNMQSNQESDASMEQQTIQAQTKIFSIGSF